MNLKRVLFAADSWDIYDKWIDFVLKKQLYLECLWIWSPAWIAKFILLKVEALILQNKDIDRKVDGFTLKIMCGIHDESSLINVYSHIMQCVKAMKMVQNWKNFRFILVIACKEEWHRFIKWKKVEDLFKDLNSAKQEYLIEWGNADAHVKKLKKEYVTAFRIVISNKDCKINGYSMPIDHMIPY